MTEQENDQAPLVSIVMIFLNAETFMRETIESVLAQTYRPLEILLVDDGSTDASPAIAREYAGRYPFVRLFEHEGHVNRGISITRNLGIANCRGKYMAFMDADDTWSPEKLAGEVALLNENPWAGMVAGATELWFSWVTEDQEREKLASLRKRDPAALRDEVSVLARGEMMGRVDPPRLLERHLSWKDGLPRVMSTLMRLDAVREVGGFEDRFRGIMEDQVFFSKMVLRHPTLVTDVCHSRYRQHSISVCYQARADAETPALPGMPGSAQTHYFVWLAGYIQQNHPGERALLDLLRDRLEKSIRDEHLPADLLQTAFPSLA
jgi:glycosyltransferase involved in cell wall biosynthesis